MFILLLILLLSVSGWCTVINVPGDYPIVQQGLNAATPHDTVLVADGAYYENLKFPPINLTLASHFIVDGDSSHLSGTIIDGSQPSNPDSASVMLINGGQDSSTCVIGFTLTGGKGTRNSLWWPGYDIHYGGGCALYQASPIIRLNHFCLDSAHFGAGVYLGPGADALIQNNEFWQNHSMSDGTIRGDTCSPQIVGNQIHHNSADSYAALVFIYCDDVLISYNYIHHNSGANALCGFFYHGHFTLMGNTISDQTTSEPTLSPGVGFEFGAADVTILNNQFLRNTNGFVHGALSLLSGSLGLILGNLFQDNSSIDKAAGLDLWDGTYTVSYNQFIDNFDSLRGVVYVGLGAVVSMDHNTFTGNTNLTNWPSGVYANISFPIEVHQNNIFSNSPPAVALSAASPYQSLDAINNWWGDPSGPYHPILNPNGLGDTVGDNVLFDPWLTSYVGVPISPPDNQPSDFRLYPAFPNPFNPTTLLGFQLPVAGRVSLGVFDITGRLVEALVNGWRVAGRHEVIFDGSHLPSGIYLYRLQAGSLSATGKLALVK